MTSAEDPSHRTPDEAPPEGALVLPVESLDAFVRAVLEATGVPEGDARIAAEILTMADLRGIDSHGVARLPTYVRFLADGTINPRPRMRIVRETPTTAAVDGDRGLGLVVGPWANRIAMEKADRMGAGWAAVRRSNHFGIAGYYALASLDRGLIGWVMTNAGNLVAPHRGAERMLGTNPIAIAFPGKEEPPVVIDMATSTVAYGKVQIARRTTGVIPEGWVVDADGRPTTDPEDMVAGGALLPLGSGGSGAGHKGYCLGALVDILCGVLPGAGWGPFAPQFALRHAKEDHDGGTGHFFGALRIDGFIDPDVFRGRIDDWVRTMRATRPQPGTGGPLIPGDPERKSAAHRRRNGVPLHPAVVDALERVGREQGVPFPA